MKTHAQALAKKNAAPSSASFAPSTMFQSRPFEQPETAEADTPEVQAKLLARALQASPIDISLYPPGQAEPGQASTEAKAVQMQPEKEQENLPVQTKLTIGKPGDRYEQEADRVASTVVNQIAAPQSPSVQREEMPEEEEDLQMKPLAGTSASLVQREDMPEEEEDLQMKPVQRVAEAGGAEASPDLETSIAQERGGGQPLDQSIRAPMEQAMGADFSGVKVHTDAQADQLNRSVQARAFTTGQDVFFRQGEYNPGSRGGQELIAHELTHVVQQNDGGRRSADPKEDLQIGSFPQTILRSPSIQRDTILHKARRIIGRWANKKQLPTNTYRWDTRSPDAIAVSGFQPWNRGGNIRLEEHVNNAFASGERQGEPTKYESQWISTGAYGMLKKLDPTFAQQVLNTNLYKIDTAVAQEIGSFKDANDHFDKINKDRPYASQREWIKLGGIPPEAVVGWMAGRKFIDQYDFDKGAPEESELQGWQPMPRS